MRRRTQKRSGAVAAESAVVFSVTFMLFLGLIVGGIGVFRYQQVACQAREAARWACVHGSGWQFDKGQPPSTKQQILENAVLPYASGMDPAKLSLDVQWINKVTGASVDWDSSTRAPTSTDAYGNRVSNVVQVTVTFQWTPDVYLAGPLNLRSVSRIPISN